MTDLTILDQLTIPLSIADLSPHFGRSAGREKMAAAAGDLLTRLTMNWRPRAMIRWFTATTAGDEIALSPRQGGARTMHHLGHAATFMTPAKLAGVGLYTAGAELAEAAATASSQKRYLDAHLYELMGLTVLEKTRQELNRRVEQEAAQRGWGVGPFLSPGSVHGWDLSGQVQLCALLPLERIGVQISTSGVLRPFATIACLIGIGPAYETTKVGSTCAVCNRREDCPMRHTSQTTQS